MNALRIDHLSKTYGSGKKALTDVSLTINEGEIFALLGPNGAGKTTLIGIVSGLVRKTTGGVEVFGHDIEREWRKTRAMVGLVPQELTLNPFDTVWDTLRFQRGFYGKPQNDRLLRKILQSLSLWDKREAMVRELSGGMKRRVLIGKALTNEPKVLFLDEPTAGVDVELRQGMWEMVANLKSRGTTIILTTHYLDEAEKMADRIGIINEGSLALVEETKTLLSRMGEKKIVLRLRDAVAAIPEPMREFQTSLSQDGMSIEYAYCSEASNIMDFLGAARDSNLPVEDVETRVRSLEEIFIQLINNKGGNAPTDAPQEKVGETSML